jgi:NADPH:quinone reductase-like Zn-dependent oxidoreductase
MVALVRSGGRAASSVGGAGEATEIDGVTVANVGSDPAHLGPLAAMILEGGLRPAITRTYSLDEAASALSDFTNGHTMGKLLIRIA